MTCWFSLLVVLRAHHIRPWCYFSCTTSKAGWLTVKIQFKDWMFTISPIPINQSPPTHPYSNPCISLNQPPLHLLPSVWMMVCKSVKWSVLSHGHITTDATAITLLCGGVARLCGVMQLEQGLWKIERLLIKDRNFNFAYIPPVFMSTMGKTKMETAELSENHPLMCSVLNTFILVAVCTLSS